MNGQKLFLIPTLQYISSFPLGIDSVQWSLMWTPLTLLGLNLKGHRSWDFSASIVMWAIPSFVIAQMVKNPWVDAGDLGLIPGLGRSLGEGNGNPLQYSYLGNPMDRGACWAAIYRVSKSQTQLSNTFTLLWSLIMVLWGIPWDHKEPDMTEQLRHS